MNQFVKGQQVRVNYRNKLRNAEIIAYGCRGNITQQHYWMVRIAGMKKWRKIAAPDINGV